MVHVTVNVYIRTLRIPLLIKSLYLVRVVKYLTAVSSWNDITVFYLGRDFRRVIESYESPCKIVPVVYQFCELLQIRFIREIHPIEKSSCIGNIGIKRVQRCNPPVRELHGIFCMEVSVLLGLKYPGESKSNRFFRSERET